MCRVENELIRGFFDVSSVQSLCNNFIDIRKYLNFFKFNNTLFIQIK